VLKRNFATAKADFSPAVQGLTAPQWHPSHLVMAAATTSASAFALVAAAGLRPAVALLSENKNLSSLQHQQPSGSIL
jgi:hypothetical protein